MERNIIYRGQTYHILESLRLNKDEYVVCVNDDKKVFYFKCSKVNDYMVYTPLDRLIKVLDKYNNKEVKKEQKILNLLTKRVEKRLKHSNKEKIKRKIYQFTDYAKRKKMKISKSDIAWYMGGIGKIRKFANIYMIIMVVSLIALVSSGFTLFNWYNEGKAVDSEMMNVLKDIEITEEEVAFEPSDKAATFSGESYDIKRYGEEYWNYAETTMMDVDFTTLLNINSDTVGWIYVNNTNVNYPFVQGGDNSFYLNHSFNKKSNVAGWLFADYRSDFNHFKKNSVIYGHGRTDQVMFGSLEKTLEESWYTNEENQIIKISTPKKNTLWQIVSIYVVPSESYYLTHTFENNKSYQKFIDTMLSRSIYDFKQDVTTKDKLLTLSTCLDNNGNRIVIQSKLILEEKRK